MINGWQSFLKLCHHAKSEEQLNELFEFFFTFEERKALKMRVELIRELLYGEKTQREISTELNISIAKITRGSNSLKLISDKLRSYLLKKIA